jgi:hypothetical protein
MFLTQLSNVSLKYYNDRCNDSYARVCCRTVKHIVGISSVDMFLRNGVIYNAVSKLSYIFSARVGVLTAMQIQPPVFGM